MATPTDRFVSTTVNETSGFQPRIISTVGTDSYSLRVPTVRFLLDSTSQRLRGAGRSASLIESQGAGNPCAQRQYGWAQFLGPEQWEQGWVAMPTNVTAGVTPPARFVFARIAPDNHTECLNGLWGAVDATATEVQEFEDAVADRLAKFQAEASKVASSTGSVAPSSTSSPNTNNNNNRTNNNSASTSGGGLSAWVISIIVVVAFVVLFACYFLFLCCWRWRQRRRDTEAGDRQELAAESSQTVEGLRGASTSTSTFAPSVSLPGQVVEHLVQDENHRLVMRAASVSSLPVYTVPAPPAPVPPLPGIQHDPLGSRDGLREEAQDEVSLATSPGGLSTTTGGGPPPAWRRGQRRRERERRRQRGQEGPPSPTRTVRSDVDTLPDYMSMASRPPSFVSRLGTLG